MIRKQYRFYGLVQGVGFRYLAVHIASSLGVTGFVKNCYDGSVLMEAEGERETLAELIRQLENGRFIRIERIDSLEIPLKGDRDFRRE